MGNVDGAAVFHAAFEVDLGARCYDDLGWNAGCIGVAGTVFPSGRRGQSIVLIRSAIEVDVVEVDGVGLLALGSKAVVEPFELTTPMKSGDVRSIVTKAQ